ncbi:FibroRumin system radical SAM peptide maturase [Eggerthellaceae bacterium 24-137]
MEKISRFTHTFDLGEHVALWHSLRMQPAFLSREIYEQFLQGECSDALKNELMRKKILTAKECEDEEVLARIRGNVPEPDVRLGYFILSENCNLACRYCFVGSDVCGGGNSSTKNMTKEVAEKAIDVFARQLELSSTNYEEEQSDIIFFGGEPLLQFDVLIHVVERVRCLAEKRPVLANTQFAVITNGTLLDEQRISKLHDLGVAVSISIDGFTAEANEMRVDKEGRPTYTRIIEVLEMYNALDVPPPSLSVTLSEKTIDDLPHMIELVRKYRVKGFGYNVLLAKGDEEKSDAYYRKASQFIIDSFVALRGDGVYEDRIMRKLNAFASARIHFSDCGATSGGQILFAPDGRIGICQGLMAESENYVADIWDEAFDANTHPFWRKWASLVPLNEESCLDCVALGICGGGCPVNARAASPDRGLHCIDSRSCIHAKKTLEFLIKDLYEIAIRKERSR